MPPADMTRLWSHSKTATTLALLCVLLRPLLGSNDSVRLVAFADRQPVASIVKETPSGMHSNGPSDQSLHYGRDMPWSYRPGSAVLLQLSTLLGFCVDNVSNACRCAISKSACPEFRNEQSGLFSIMLVTLNAFLRRFPWYNYTACLVRSIRVDSVDFGPAASQPQDSDDSNQTSLRLLDRSCPSSGGHYC